MPRLGVAFAANNLCKFMQIKILFKKLLIVFCVSAIIFSAAFFLILADNLSSPNSYAKQTPTIPGVAFPGHSSRLNIPKININAVIESVGLTPQGAMAVPKDPANVAWFSLGMRPGDVGSAVIAGHYGWKNHIPAAFDNLSKLQKGDKIYIKDEKNATITFVVRESRRFSEYDDASVVFGSADGKAHLNLVTCEGTWDKVRKSYSNRLVVFTDRE